MADQSINFPQFGANYHPDFFRKRIRAVAKQLREICKQSRALPFDPYACANSIGILVTERDLPTGISGRLRLHSAAPIIEISNKDGKRRQRFSVCHELAHLFFLDGKPAFFFERCVPYHAEYVLRREEEICNMIAAELLMPVSSFSRHSRNLPCSFDALCKISDTFAVSLYAAFRRMCDLGLLSAGYMLWDKEKRKVLVGSRRLYVRAAKPDWLAKPRIRRLLNGRLKEVESLLLSNTFESIAQKHTSIAAGYAQLQMKSGPIYVNELPRFTPLLIFTLYETA